MGYLLSMVLRKIGKYLQLSNINFDDTIKKRSLSKLSENHKIVQVMAAEIDPPNQPLIKRRGGGGVTLASLILLLTDYFPHFRPDFYLIEHGLNSLLTEIRSGRKHYQNNDFRSLLTSPNHLLHH